MPVDQLGIGMIGAGSMAVHHLEAWGQNPGTKVVAITNRTEDRAASLAREFGISHVCSTADELVHRADVDAVSISLPHNLHHPMATLAIEAGKHVFCEKPLATSLFDARQMLARAQRAGVKTGIQFGHRVLPGLGKLRTLFQEGAIGRAEYLECSWCFDWARDPAFPLVWRFRRDAAGAGALADLGVYAIDVARWLLGEFNSVVGHLETFVAYRPLFSGGEHFDQVVRRVEEGTLDLSHDVGEVENEDECTWLATFACGAHGFFRSSRVRSEQRLLLSGSQGALLWRLDGDRLWERSGGQHTFVEVELARAAPRATFIDPFVRDVGRDTELGPTFLDGVRAQEVMDAVLISAVERRWTAVPVADGRAFAARDAR